LPDDLGFGFKNVKPKPDEAKPKPGLQQAKPSTSLCTIPNAMRTAPAKPLPACLTPSAYDLTPRSGATPTPSRAAHPRYATQQALAFLNACVPLAKQRPFSAHQSWNLRHHCRVWGLRCPFSIACTAFLASCPRRPSLALPHSPSQHLPIAHHLHHSRAPRIPPRGACCRRSLSPPLHPSLLGAPRPSPYLSVLALGCIPSRLCNTAGVPTTRIRCLLRLLRDVVLVHSSSRMYFVVFYETLHVLVLPECVRAPRQRPFSAHQSWNLRHHCRVWGLLCPFSIACTAFLASCPR
ncbi:hypothetical protein B0H10DRAFT_2381469, partial [Mycena sp. CBHHK59/15]